MDEMQAMETVIRAIKAANENAQTEYCLIMLDNRWWSCMTKAEWSAWVQAIFSVIAIISSIFVAFWIFRQNRRQLIYHAYQNAALMSVNLGVALDLAVDMKSKSKLLIVQAGLNYANSIGTMIRTEELPFDAVKAINGMRTIAVQAIAALEDLSKKDDLNSNIWDGSFEFWSNRVKLHTKVIDSYLPKRKTLYKKILITLKSKFICIARVVFRWRLK